MLKDSQSNYCASAGTLSFVPKKEQATVLLFCIALILVRTEEASGNSHGSSPCLSINNVAN